MEQVLHNRTLRRRWLPPCEYGIQDSTVRGIYSISHEILRIILSFLRFDVQTLEECRSVCRTWRYVLTSGVGVWSSISVDDIIPSNSVRNQLRWTEGEALDISIRDLNSFNSAPWRSCMFQTIPRWRTLRLLWTSKSKEDDCRTLAHAINWNGCHSSSSLKTIEIASSTILSSVPIDNSIWSNIRTLIIKKGGATIALSSFSILVQLQTLEMNYCSVVNDYAVVPKPILPSLRVCYLRGCNDVSLLLLDSGFVEEANIQRVRFSNPVSLPRLHHLELRAYALVELSRINCPLLSTLIWKGAWTSKSGYHGEGASLHHPSMPSVTNIVVESTTSPDLLFKLLCYFPNVRFLRLVFTQEDKTLSKGDVDSLVEMMDTSWDISESNGQFTNPVTVAKMCLEGFARQPYYGGTMVGPALECVELTFNGLSEMSKQTLRSFATRVLRIRASWSTVSMQIVCKWNGTEREVIA